MDSAASSGKALAVIDVQEDYTGLSAKPPFPYEHSATLIETLNLLIRKCAAQNIPVLYVKQEFGGRFGTLISNIFAHGTAQKGKPGAELDRRLEIVSDLLFSKPRANAYSNPDFGACLKKCGASDLYLAGVDAEYCVWSTARAAKRRGFNVHLVIDALLLKNKARWKRLLEKYRKEGFRLVSGRDATQAAFESKL